MHQVYDKVKFPETGEQMGTGWLAPMPDFRDFTQEKKEIRTISEALKMSAARTLPETVDLREYCSPVENQGSIGSCTAHAGTSIVEYYQRRAFGKYLEGSRLFVYKTTRNLMGVTGDTGGWLRNVMAALALFGVPPEKYFPYTVNKDPEKNNGKTFDDEPSAFVYGLADNYEALRYFTHDPMTGNNQPDKVLKSVKQYLAFGIPSMFGFYGFPSFGSSDAPGSIPYPGEGERAKWGHAIVAIGFDDNKKIKNTRSNKEAKGALLIRNSWGSNWGNSGYGWLPYDYVLNKLAMDFWSLLSMEFVDTRNFGLN